MKPLDFPPEYFEKFSTKPVLLKPYDPASKDVARKYIEELTSLFRGINVEIQHKGSTAFGIVGKGDIEIGVYPCEKDWEAAIERLSKKYGAPGNVEEEYARFNQTRDGFDVEITALKGDQAELDKKQTQFLLQHPDLLREYEDIKKKSAYSKREYQKQKYLFLNKVLEMMPE